MVTEQPVMLTLRINPQPLLTARTSMLETSLVFPEVPEIFQVRIYTSNLHRAVTCSMKTAGSILNYALVQLPAARLQYPITGRQQTIRLPLACLEMKDIVDPRFETAV
jgi:hypothetical protein